MSSREKTELDRFPTERESKDRAYELSQDLGIPTVGWLIKQVVTSPLQKRQEQWFEDVRQVLEKHEQEIKGLSETNPTKLDELLTLIGQSYNAASRTHLADKRAMFCSVIKSTIIDQADFNLASYYIRLIDEFQPIHIKLLNSYGEPERLYMSQFEAITASRSTDVRIGQLAAMSYPEFSDFIGVAENDLEVRSLIDRNGETSVRQGQMKLRGALTSMGTSFLKHVRADEI